ncbi:MAG: hypothetical protein OXF08_00590 [Bacteroidetes bacterium]|nr:hypothetical protein [Bacteroidota bacterium]
MHKYIFVVLVLSLMGCSPALHPLYLDYEYSPKDTIPFYQIESALQEAGWSIATSPSDNSVTTADREIQNWLLYRIVVYVEVIPIGPQHIRLLVHPYRVYFTGSRSKIPFLKPGIHRKVIRKINHVFESYNIVEVGRDV